MSEESIHSYWRRTKKTQRDSYASDRRCVRCGGKITKADRKKKPDRVTCTKCNRERVERGFKK